MRSRRPTAFSVRAATIGFFAMTRSVWMSLSGSPFVLVSTTPDSAAERLSRLIRTPAEPTYRGRSLAEYATPTERVRMAIKTMNHFRRAITSTYSLKFGASLPATGDSTSPLIVAPAVANARRRERKMAPP